jgi:PST family polysaccharide transporter
MRLHRPKLEPAVTEMVRLGGGLLGYSVLTYLGSAAPTVALGRSQGTTAAGLYARTQRLVGLSTGYLVAPVSAVAFPVLSRLNDQRDRWTRYYYTVQVLLALPVVGTCSLLVAHPDLVVEATLGPQWDSAAPVMVWLAVAAILTVPCLPTGWVLVSLGRGDRLVRWGAIGWPVMIVGSLTGLPYGPVGVAAGYAAASALLVLPCLRYAFDRTPLTVPRALLAAWGSAPAALAATAASVATARLLPTMGPIPSLAAVGLVHGTVYLGVVARRGENRLLLRFVIDRLRGGSAPLADTTEADAVAVSNHDLLGGGGPSAHGPATTYEP